MKSAPCVWAFTLVEILLAIAVISVLTSAGYYVATTTKETARENKLRSDVTNLNTAVQLYVANGGTIPANATAQQVLTKLQSRATGASAAVAIGLSGSFVDPRLTPSVQSSDQASGSELRAVWVPAAGAGEAGKFAVVATGQGIREFSIDESKAAAGASTPAPEVRQQTMEAVSLAESNPHWVWGVSDSQPAAAELGATPTTGAAAGPSATPSASNLSQLDPPSFSRGGGSYDLSLFPMADLTLSNPNLVPSKVYYQVAGGAPQEYTGGTLPSFHPDTQVTAWVKSNSAAYSDSSMVNATYDNLVKTLQVSLSGPTSLTYQQAGGAMYGSASVAAPVATATVTTSGISSAYQGTSYYVIYTSVGSATPLTTGVSSGSATTAAIDLSLSNWGTASSLTVSAAAKAVRTDYYADSSVQTISVGKSPTALAMPSISPTSGERSALVAVTVTASGTLPAGFQIYYTQDGSDPGVGSNGRPTSVAATLLPLGGGTSGTFTPESGGTGALAVKARVYGPSGYESWFTPSSVISVVYTEASSGIPEGALVGSADVNGVFVGSLIYSDQNGSMPSNINFNSGAQIQQGNIYFPGTPVIDLQNGGVIVGNQYNADGTQVIPATDTRKIVDLNGSIYPTNYTVRFNNNAVVQGKVYRRSTPPEFPTVSKPPSPTNSNGVNINSPQTTAVNPAITANVNLNNGAGDVKLAPGSYGSLNASSGTSFVIGDPNSTTPQVYSFQSLSLNSGSQLKVVGPVILTMSGNLFINGGSIMGNSAHPEWLQLNMYSGDFQVNSNGQAYARVVAPKNNVGLDGTFTGSVVAKYLRINGNGVAFTVPPVIGS
ncbi:type II secretion system protein [Terrimicrobium sacchariphilum]|uniref:type II secretion system protein n=1 Tax=Terrimicrobium sacchariphilum TaxID=690879 RepID=UPI001EDC2C82|nr:type II secretion system protein [Terrimicrobium sacchariphilum]